MSKGARKKSGGRPKNSCHRARREPGKGNGVLPQRKPRKKHSSRPKRTKAQRGDKLAKAATKTGALEKSEVEQIEEALKSRKGLPRSVEVKLPEKLGARISRHIGNTIPV